MSFQEKRKDKKKTRKQDHEGEIPHEESRQETTPEDDYSLQNAAPIQEAAEKAISLGVKVM